MPIHILTLQNRREIARSTIEFTFSKPEGLTYKPGQYAGFTLINPTETDAGGITRRFSLLSTPDEAYIRIAMRIQNSAYKRVLNSLPMGSEIKFAGPTGNFTLHDDSNIPAVLLAGGIGITPFYCMAQHAAKQQSPQHITLFYGNQSFGDAPYLAELTALQNDNSHFKLVATMDKPDNVWQGETGYITHTMIKKYVPDLSTPIFYVCGGPAMVSTLQELLVEMGIENERIKVEDFPGY